MKADIKEQWVKDLRSGDYSQVEGTLSDGEGYCCLGVLCEQAVRAGVIEKTATPDGVRYGTETEFSWGALPDPVVKWAELESVDPVVSFVDEYQVGDETFTDDLHENLSSVNDEHKKTFPEIADLIEGQL